MLISMLLFKKEGKTSVCISKLSLLYKKFQKWKHVAQRERRTQKIIRQFQIGLEIALSSKLDHFKSIAEKYSYWIFPFFFFLLG